MGVYYYTPFERTDDNERQTWNLCLSWGAKFANCKTGNEVVPIGRDVGSSGPRKYMSPEELADQLLSDGLENHKINIILICCYGAGPLESEGRDLKTKPNWIGAPDASDVYAGGTLAQSLAKFLGAGLRLKASLGGRTDVPLKVAGFMGPTYTKGGSLQVTSDQKKNVRAPAWGFARWFDATGSASTSNTNVTDTGLGAPAKVSLDDLSGLVDGDELVIMGHGNWIHGGMILPFAGPAGESMTGKPVLRAERMQDKPDNRANVEATWKK